MNDTNKLKSLHKIKSECLKFFQDSLCLALRVPQYIKVSVWAHLLGKGKQNVKVPVVLYAKVMLERR